MTIGVLEELCSSQPLGGWPIDATQVAGYSEDELKKIEKLYDVRLLGSFRQFMTEMGRCSGGLLGDDPIILYRPAWSVRGQILFQVKFFSSMQDIGAFDYLEKPFVFSWEAESQYYFMMTKSQTPDAIYCYDENNETVRPAGFTFMEYMKDVLRRYRGYGRPVICRGELLNIT
jgi:hypothetical protein